MPSSADAERFLSKLGSPGCSFTYQSVGEGKQKGNHSLKRILHGPLQERMEELVALNIQGAGIFVTINETDGRGRKVKNIIRIRSIWQDDDDGYQGSFPLQPSMVVASSPGKFQRYWLSEDLRKEDYVSLMRTMIKDFGSDKRTGADLARVLRLPGFYHQKAVPHLVTAIEASGKRYSRLELLEAFPRIEPPPPLVSPISTRSTTDVGFRIRNALTLIDPDHYDSWIKVGQILHQEFEGHEEGFGLWVNWAQGSPKFDLNEHEYKWGTFGNTEGARLGLGTLFWLAEKALYGE
jgi:hypothetical protein